MKIIELVGDPHDRGRLYGRSISARVDAVFEHWYSSLIVVGDKGGTLHEITVSDYLQNFLNATNFLTAVEQWAPELLEELEGIASYISIPFSHLFCFQLFDEEWLYGLSNRVQRPTEKCTAFALINHQSQSSYAGQNMDIPAWVDGYQNLLRINGSNGKPDALVFSISGHLGLNGVNSAGIGITCNTLAQLNHSQEGLPVTFIVRSVLEKKTLDDAVEFIQSIPHASGQNYILSSASQVRCFECCSTSVVEYVPNNSQNIFHTNHALINKDCVDPPLAFGSYHNSCLRLESIKRRLDSKRQSPALSWVKSALSAHDDRENPVSRVAQAGGGTIGFTAGSSIYEFLSPPRLHLAAGPPCITEYMSYDFARNPKNNFFNELSD